MASPFYWPVLVPCALRAPAPVNFGVRPSVNNHQTMSTVFLAISPNGLKEAIELASMAKGAVWCGSDAVSETEYESLKNQSVSRFTYPLQGETADVLQSAIYTIEDHHPGATIWTEQPKSEGASPTLVDTRT